MNQSQNKNKLELRKFNANQQSNKESIIKIKSRIRKSNFHWTSEETMVLIENVRKFENLWNPSYHSYRNRKLHQITWERIAKSVSLPKQEVIIRWNCLRSNYRMYLKNRRRLNTNVRGGNKKGPHRFFLAMAFLDPVFKFDIKNQDSNTIKTENDKNIVSEGDFNCSSDSQYLEEVENTNACPIEECIIKEETSSSIFEENLPSISEPEDNSQQNDSRPPTFLPKNARSRKMQTFANYHNYHEDASDEDLESLRKTKLKLEIYNLQLDAMKKEIELGLKRSHLTAEFYENRDVPSLEEM